MKARLTLILLSSTLFSCSLLASEKAITRPVVDACPCDAPVKEHLLKDLGKISLQSLAEPHRTNDPVAYNAAAAKIFDTVWSTEKIENAGPQALKKDFGLVLAALLGHVEMATALLAKGARVTIGSNMPLNFAVRGGNLKMVQLLLAAEAPLDTSIWRQAQLYFEPGKNEVLTWLMTAHSKEYRRVAKILYHCYDKIDAATAAHAGDYDILYSKLEDDSEIDFHLLFKHTCYQAGEYERFYSQEERIKPLLCLIEHNPKEFLRCVDSLLAHFGPSVGYPGDSWFQNVLIAQRDRIKEKLAAQAH